MLSNLIDHSLLPLFVIEWEYVNLIILKMPILQCTGALNAVEIYAFIDINKCITTGLTFGIERKRNLCNLNAAATTSCIPSTPCD